jgi:hypothetical protein
VQLLLTLFTIRAALRVKYYGKGFILSFINKLIIAVLVGFIICNPVNAASKAHYLPVKTDPLIELDLERLATLAKMPVLSKPFHILTVKQYLEKIKSDYPQLYTRINAYLNRYQKSYGLTHLDIEASYSTYDDKNLGNTRGMDSASNIKAEASGYWQLSDNFNLSLGGTVFDGSDGLIPNHTYLSYFNEYIQFDLGFKEIWLSPLQESAMLLSTNAEPVARFSISSPRPLTRWNFEYDISFGKLETQQGIRLGEERFSGKPGFLTMHFSAQLFDWWTVGINRTMMFGGGRRDVDLGDIWEAIVDPVSGDNCGGESDLQDCSEEAGNQQASISTKFDFNWGSFYFEMAGEDTANYSSFQLGKIAYSFGLFFPYLTEDSSLLAEFQLISDAWYVHGIYSEGYRNNLHSMGHWWGDEKAIDDSIGAQVFTLRYNHDLSDKYHFETKIRYINNDPDMGREGTVYLYDYSKGKEMELSLYQITESAQWRYQLYFGSDTLDEDFARLSVEYSWR